MRKRKAKPMKKSEFKVLDKDFVRMVRNTTAAMLVLCFFAFGTWGLSTINIIPNDIALHVLGVLIAIKLALMCYFGIYIQSMVRTVLYGGD